MRSFPLLLALLAACDAPKAQDPTGTLPTDPFATDPVATTTPSDPGTPPVPTSAASCGFAAAPDLDADPDVVEVEVTADETDWDPGTGTSIRGLSFGGTVPGPLIELTVGQTLRFRFTNETAMATTLHWHGLRVPEEMDGVAQMADPVEPGETFTYEFTVQDAGFYWYHPHMDTAMVMEQGLYGGIVVHEAGEAPPACDLPLVLDDVLLDASGQLAPMSMSESMTGRLGNLLLANGRSDAATEVVGGSTVLLRLVNAANTRYFDLGIPDVPVTVVGTDGGFVAEPWTVDRLVLAPGERLLVTFEVPDEPGEVLRLENLPVSMGEMGMGGMGGMGDDPLGDGPLPIATFSVLDGDPGGPWVPPVVEVPVLGGEPVTHQWVLDERMMSFTIDGETWPNVPLVAVPGGVPTAFGVNNRSDMRHPFHIHGNRFQIVARDGVAVAEPRWKDTWDVPPGGTITVVSELDNPGEWLYHCHILEHADGGMAGLLTVQ